MAHWKVLQNEEWKEFTAQEVLTLFESNILTGTSSIKAGEYSTPKPLSLFIRELVWQARLEENQSNVTEEVYFALAEVAPIPTALSDLGGRITYVNKAFCEFLGYQKEELIGMTVGRLSHEEDHQKEVQQGKLVIAGSTNSFQMEKRYICKNGDIKKGQLSLAILHQDGQPHAILAQIYDLTAQLELRQALIQAQSITTLGKVSQHVTHDLKNILMALHGTLDLLQDFEESFEDEEKELINEALVMCDQGKKLIQNLLSFNPDAFQSLEPLSLHDWLDKMRPTLTLLVKPYELKMEVDARVTIQANQDLLERALINLCINAKQALEEKQSQVILKEEETSIRVRLSLYQTLTDHLGKETTYYTLSVIDQGIGMTPEIKARILEPYFTTRAKAGGSGIGLANVWNACQQHEAQLSIDSQWLKGSSFHLIFKELAQ